MTEKYTRPTALFIAAALRALRLYDAPGGRYRVVKMDADKETLIEASATFRAVVNLCGASGRTTLRKAAERDGLAWPDSAAAFLAAMNRIV